MSAFVNLIAVLALLLSFAPFGFLSAGGSNVLRYPITVDKPGIVEEASAIDASGANLEVVIDKRFDNARFTYYADGMGACGQWNSPGDFVSTRMILSFYLYSFTFCYWSQIVALNTPVKLF